MAHEPKDTDYVGGELTNKYLRPGFKNNPTNNQQRMTERMYVRVLSEMSMNRFQWTGFPHSVDRRFLEKILYSQALAVFYWDNTCDKYFALRATPSGMWDMYDNPISFRVYGNTMINEDVTNDKCVPIWSNYMRMPDIDIVMLYAKKLANIDRSIEINADNMRQTKFIKSSENQQLSFANVNRQMQEGMAYIQVSEGMNLDNIEVLDLSVDAKYLPALISAKRTLWNECLTLLGVNNNAGEDKKERLVSDEVDANSDEVLVHRSSALKARREAAEKINRRFKMPDGSPLKIEVNFVNDMQVPRMPNESLEMMI